ncbi:MAG: MBL fold metallo-hydrolase [Bacteroidales bacterium]|nr:MBL fold metallo-hydrolase [Bacteroidales bacterium]
MRITILYDNTVFRPELNPDWGFSCLVEAYDRTILFDTGTDGSILLDNMEKMNLDPSVVDEVFISHAHFDHVGGLSSFLDMNSDVKLYVPPSFRAVQHVRETIYVNQPMELHEHFYSTGEIDQIEQSLVVQTDRGLVVVVGCSHPMMEDILSTASQFGNIYGIAGGLHGFRQFELFRDLELICPTHCTQHIKEIKRLYPEKYVEGGAGRVIEI